MNIELVKQYVYLFLGWQIPSSSFLDKPSAQIDTITFEVDLANEIYLEILEQVDVDPYPFSFAKQQMMAYSPKQSIFDFKNSHHKPYHMLAEVEETSMQYYPILDSVSTTKQAIDKLIYETIESFEKNGYIKQLKKIWD